MSRFSGLKKYLSLSEALLFYFKMKTGQWSNFRLKKLKHSFALRNNPYDFATFTEVLLREDYHFEPGFEPLTIIDGGANIGLTSLYFANRFPHAKILSVEPDKNNFSLLLKNTQPYSNIVPVNCGIWNKKTHLTVIDKGEGNNAFTVQELAGPVAGSVPALTIGDLLLHEQWKTADILKLDIEGSEKKIFEAGYESWLPFVKILVIELHDRMVPGCTDTMMQALSHYHFSGETKGENMIFFNRDYVKAADKNQHSG